MTITALEPFARGKNRIAVYLNDEFSFVLYKGELSKYGLLAGMDLSEELYERIVNETLTKRARLRGMNLLQKMDRTESDIRQKLIEGGYPEEVVDDAIDYLKSFHYIDDSRYASDYIRFKRNSMSRREIERKLLEKGISPDIVAAQFDEMDEYDSETSEDHELNLVKKLLKKKMGINEEQTVTLEYEEKMKIFSYFYRKGFSMELVERAYRDLT